MFKENYMSHTEEGVRFQIASRLFTMWDYNIRNNKTAYMKATNACYLIKASNMFI